MTLFLAWIVFPLVFGLLSLGWTGSMREWKHFQGLAINHTYWTYRMVNTPRPLEEKMCLFWHGTFCVGYSKCQN